MKHRLVSIAVLAVMLLNSAVSFASPDLKTAQLKKAEVSRLVAQLPASDAVAVFDAKRFLGDALPKVLSANQPMLTEINAKIAEMERTTGIDLRKFDQVAVGVTMKQVSATETDYETIALANGDINAGALIAVAKLASKGTYREEKVGSRSVYVFSTKDLVQNTTVKPANSKVAEYFDKALKGLTKDVAVTALDAKTLAIGSLDRVRQTVEGSSRISPELNGFLSPRETTVLTFALKAPNGLSKFISLDNDALGMNLDSIDYLSGSLDVLATGASVALNARTKKPDQAQSLKETIDGLKMVGGAIFGGSKRPDQQVYGRLIKNAKVENRGSDVSLEVTVPQADIDAMIGLK